MDIAYATTKKIDVLVHKCRYLIEIDHGKVIAVCRGCGKWFDYNEILKRINVDETTHK